MHGRCVIDAIAKKSDDVAHFLQGQNDPLLLVGIDFGEEVGLLRGVPEGFVVQLVELMSREHALGGEADEPGDVAGDERVVSGDQLERDAKPRQMCDGVPDTLLWLIEKRQEPHEGHVTLVVSRIRLLFRDRTRGDGEDTDALVAPCFVTRLEPLSPVRVQSVAVLGSRADLQDVVEGALDDQASARGVTDGNGDALANEVERDLGQLVDPGEIWPPRVQDGLVQRIVEARLERRISCRELQDFG